jgi:MFS transporter, DHA3 family, macrolide efflux protein
MTETHITKDSRNIAFLLAGRLIASTGSGVFGFALGLYVLDLTGSAGIFSLILSLAIIPGILVNLFAGPLLDKVSKKRVVVVADLLSALFAGAFLLLFLVYPSSIGLIIVFIMLNSIIQSVYTLALTASIPEIVESSNVARLNSLMQVITTLLTIGGPVLGALLYKTIGMRSIIALDTLCYLGSALLAAMLVFSRASRPAEETGGYWGDLQVAVRYLQGQKVLVFLLFVCVLINAIYIPMVMLVMPYINYQVIKVSGLQLSFIEAAFGVGGTLGGLYISMRSSTDVFIRKLFPLLIIQGALLLLWTFPAFPSFSGVGKTFITAGFCLILGITGIVNMIQNIPIYTHFQLGIPEELRARILGFINVAVMVSLPLSFWVYGLLLENFSWHYITLVSGILLIIVCILSSKNRHFIKFVSELNA